MESAARAASEEYATTLSAAAARTCTHRALGHEDEARAALAALAADGFAALKFDETWLAAVAFLAEAAYALGEAAHAKTLYDLLAPYAGRVAVATSEVSLGAVPRYLGLLAAASGRRDVAVAHPTDGLRGQHAYRRAAPRRAHAPRPRRPDRRPRAGHASGRCVSGAGTGRPCGARCATDSLDRRPANAERVLDAFRRQRGCADQASRCAGANAGRRSRRRDDRREPRVPVAGAPVERRELAEEVAGAELPPA